VRPQDGGEPPPGFHDRGGPGPPGVGHRRHGFVMARARTTVAPSSTGTPGTSGLPSCATSQRDPGVHQASETPGLRSTTDLIAISRSAADCRAATPNRHRLAGLPVDVSPTRPTLGPLLDPPSTTYLERWLPQQKELRCPEGGRPPGTRRLLLADVGGLRLRSAILSPGLRSV
jgi:hypothetical protein